MKITGAIIGFLAWGLSYYWFGWEMLLILFLVEFSQNLEKAGNKHSKGYDKDKH